MGNTILNDMLHEYVSPQPHNFLQLPETINLAEDTAPQVERTAEDLVLEN